MANIATEIETIVSKLLDSASLTSLGMGPGSPNAKAGDLLSVARVLDSLVVFVGDLAKQMKKRDEKVNMLEGEVLKLEKLNDEKDALIEDFKQNPISVLNKGKEGTDTLTMNFAEIVKS